MTVGNENGYIATHSAASADCFNHSVTLHLLQHFHHSERIQTVV